MNPKCPSVAECKSSVRQSNWTENQLQLLVAANTLMENCESDPTITVNDGLACLEHGGLIADMGARILYVLTGRDDLGWHGAGYNNLPFHVEKQNWLDYLAGRGRSAER